MDPILRLRREFFNDFYHFFCEFYATHFNKTTRKLLEVFTLSAALVVLFLWGYTHFVFVKDPENCIPHVEHLPSDMILQIEIYHNSTQLWKYRNKAIARSIILNEISRCNSSNLSTETGHLVCADEDIKSLLGRVFHSPVKQCTLNDYSRCNHVNRNIMREVAHTVTHYPQPLLYIIARSELIYMAPEYTLIEFVQEPGYLRLTKQSRKKLNISTRMIHIDPANATCFGNFIGRFLLRYILGYNTLIYSSLKEVMQEESGYLHDAVSGSYYWFRFQMASSVRYLLGVLPTIFFTLLVSTYVRQCHFHFFKLLYYVRNVFFDGTVSPVHAHQVSLLLITYASVGLVVVICEALDDSGLFCLMMLLVVVEADHFYAVFCRSTSSKKYWPRFFFLYHFLPYAYYTRFHGQFVMLAFIAHWLLIQHSMLYFFHRYELPLVEQRRRRLPFFIGRRHLVAIIHAPVRPFPRISLAIIDDEDNDERSREVDIDVSDVEVDNLDTSAAPNNAAASSSNSVSSTNSSTSNSRNRFHHNSEMLVRRPLS
ncbi:membralin-like isoform X2 [Dysidea avara]|uniref:membralin-like isoform X2 n=1 Tax=Dysidea avara TaxID=196820 RepID=UPI0033169638